MMPTIAYLAEGKLYLKDPSSAPRLIESTFAQGLLDRAARDRQRNEWKGKGMGWSMSRGMNPFAGMGPPPDVRRIRFTGISRGASGKELLYALDTDYVGGLFSFDTGENYERRIYHRNEFRAHDLTRHPTEELLAFSLQGDDGTANLALMEAEGRGLREITEGDSVDESPTWVPGAGKTLVFQSAGVARNGMGFVAALGPYAVQKLDLDQGEMETLLEDDAHDYLVPRMTGEGTLYCIRRPYQLHGPPVSPWKVAGDILLFPLRVARSIVHFLNFFSLMFSRKPLITSGGPPKEGPDQRHLMLWGKMVDAEKVLRESRKRGEEAIVPKDWELIRRTASGEETVLADGVLSFDLAPAGGVIYSNGTAVYHLDEKGDRTEITKGKMIERVSVV